jgi:hypothetical protein
VSGGQAGDDRIGVAGSELQGGSVLKKIMTLLAATALVGSALFASAGVASASAPEEASPAAGAAIIACQANLPSWPSSGSSGTCTNTAAAGVGLHGTTPATITSINASFSYSEPCFAGEPPLLGNASGTATLGSSAGPITVSFDWVRLGLTAVVVTSGPTAGGHPHGGAGAGVAAFAPLPPLGTCAPGGSIPLTAQVVGVAATAGT